MPLLLIYKSVLTSLVLDHSSHACCWLLVQPLDCVSQVLVVYDTCVEKCISGVHYNQ